MRRRFNFDDRRGPHGVFAEHTGAASIDWAVAAGVSGVHTIYVNLGAPARIGEVAATSTPVNRLYTYGACGSVGRAFDFFQP
jgi:hypothetical protein